MLARLAGQGNLRLLCWSHRHAQPRLALYTGAGDSISVPACAASALAHRSFPWNHSNLQILREKDCAIYILFPRQHRILSWELSDSTFQDSKVSRANYGL